MREVDQHFYNEIKVKQIIWEMAQIGSESTQTQPQRKAAQPPAKTFSGHRAKT